MKSIKLMLAGVSLLLLCGCGTQVQKENEATCGNESKENAVIENMMSRRSIRKYKPQAVNRDTMQIILNCGINAPNGQNKQSWEIRVVDNPEFINGITEVYKKQNPKATEDPNFKNMFRNASTVVFIANDKSYDLSQIDCELKEVVELYKKEKSPSSYIIDKYDYLFRCIHLELIRGLLSHIYILDVCRTAHRIAVSKGFCCRPEMTEAMDLSITGFVHPFTEGGRNNDWKMTNGNICILTGSNMAGKSTTLKAITITVWLAHCGLPVPARSMTCPVFDGIYTSINLPDSLRDGRSHFMAEILRIKEVLQKAKSGKRCLIILDEMFRGTNAQDAFEASIAVNELLRKYPHCLFLISTHILEYAKHFEKDNTCCFYYMDSKIENDQFICPYQLLEGISEAQVGYWLVRKELEGLI